MKQAVYHGIRDVRVEDVPEPQPGPGQLKIEVQYCGICGSDLHEYLHGLFPVSPFGHETVGTVVGLGDGTSGFEIGDRVLAVHKDGFAEYATAPAGSAFKIPDDISWKRAVVWEPMAGAAYAIDRGGVTSGDTVLITGAGPVGLLLMLGLKAVGVGQIFITDLSGGRREKALEMGATAVFDPSREKIPARMKALTGGQGVDVAIEAVGVEASLKDCLASTRYGGKVIVQGIFTERVPIHMLGFVTREMTMIGCNSIKPDLAMTWMQEKGLAPESIVTSVVPLDEIADRGFEALCRDKEREIKILIRPGEND